MTSPIKTQFEVIEITELIESFPFVFHEKSENVTYYLNQDYKDEVAKRSLRLLGILTLPEIENVCSYLGHLKSIENKSRGIVFTDEKDKLGILYSPITSIQLEDYTLVLREKNQIFYRGGVIPGKGYQVEKIFDVSPKENFIWPDLSNPKKNYPNHTPDILAFVAGYNPHFD